MASRKSSRKQNRKSRSNKKNYEKHEFKKSLSPQCPVGYELRDSYKTKKGKFVPVRCIEKQGIFPGKASVVTRRAVEKKSREHKKAASLAKLRCNIEGCKVPTSCPKGEILREGYIRNRYVKNGKKLSVKKTLVAPGCIKNRGSPGKGPKLIVLNDKEHLLSDFGYYNVKDLTEKQRHSRLRKLLKHVTEKHDEVKAYNYLIRALTARSTLTKKTSPESSGIFEADKEWAMLEKRKHVKK